MTNAITTATPQLPAHLQRLIQTQAGDAIGGIVSGAHPKISYRGMRFRLNQPNGEEQLVETQHIDVIIVDSNPHISKVYYAKGYNKNEEASAPDCYSDNGVAPSSRVSTPQCATCAMCPWNAWGSKVNDNGQKTKACSDSKKIAVILANNAAGPLYELRIPAASLADFKGALKPWIDAGYPYSAIQFRVSFDATVEYPKLVFTALGYINEVQAGEVFRRSGSKEAIEAVGKDDTPKAVGLTIAAPVAQPALPPPPAHVAAMTVAPPVAVAPPPMAPVPQYAPPPPQPAPAAFAPQPVPTPQAFAPPGVVSQPAPAAFAPPGVIADVPMNPPPAEKKTRKPRTPKAPVDVAAAMAPAAPAQNGFGFAPPTQVLGTSASSTAPAAPAPATQPVPLGQAPVAGVVAAPAATNADLDAMLSGVFS